MYIERLVNYKDEYAMRLAQGRTFSHNVRDTYFTNFEEDVMSLAEKMKAKAAALKAGKKSTPAKSITVKTAKASKKAVATAKQKKGDHVPTPRAESKTATILGMLKSGASREKIQKKYGMEKLSDVGWYISKFKAKGLLPKSFERE